MSPDIVEEIYDSPTIHVLYKAFNPFATASNLKKKCFRAEKKFFENLTGPKLEHLARDGVLWTRSFTILKIGNTDFIINKFFQPGSPHTTNIIVHHRPCTKMSVTYV